MHLMDYKAKKYLHVPDQLVSIFEFNATNCQQKKIFEGKEKNFVNECDAGIHKPPPAINSASTGCGLFAESEGCRFRLAMMTDRS